jgi:SAM-dependent methyltransferase
MTWTTVTRSAGQGEPPTLRLRVGGPFDVALRGGRCVLELAGGERVELPSARWHARPDTFDELLLSRCVGPTLDVGCGPGRLTSALGDRGVPALGIDVSPVAVGLTRRRGAAALCTDVFGQVPDEGRWRHVLLADGNVGIGGDPAALLRRVAALIAPAGTVLVEADAPGTGLRRQAARLVRSSQMSQQDGPEDWFPWARLAVDAVAGPAALAGLRVRATETVAGRWFAELGRG